MTPAKSEQNSGSTEQLGQVPKVEQADATPDTIEGLSAQIDDQTKTISSQVESSVLADQQLVDKVSADTAIDAADKQNLATELGQSDAEAQQVVKNGQQQLEGVLNGQTDGGTDGAVEESGAGEKEVADPRKLFLDSVEENLQKMLVAGRLTPEEAEDKRHYASLVENGFSEDPRSDALLFSLAGHASEAELIPILNDRRDRELSSKITSVDTSTEVGGEVEEDEVLEGENVPDAENNKDNDEEEGGEEDAPVELGVPIAERDSQNEESKVLATSMEQPGNIRQKINKPVAQEQRAAPPKEMKTSITSAEYDEAVAYINKGIPESSDVSGTSMVFAGDALKSVTKIFPEGDEAKNFLIETTNAILKNKDLYSQLQRGPQFFSAALEVHFKDNPTDLGQLFIPEMEQKTYYLFRALDPNRKSKPENQPKNDTAQGNKTISAGTLESRPRPDRTETQPTAERPQEGADYGDGDEPMDGSGGGGYSEGGTALDGAHEMASEFDATKQRMQEMLDRGNAGDHHDGFTTADTAALRSSLNPPEDNRRSEMRERYQGMADAMHRGIQKEANSSEALPEEH